MFETNNLEELAPLVEEEQFSTGEYGSQSSECSSPEFRDATNLRPMSPAAPMIAQQVAPTLCEPKRTPSTLPNVLPLMYHELRRLGRSLLRQERCGHTLQPTAVVNEAYIRLAGIDLEIHDRAHCLHLVGQTMRRVLIDYGRQKHRLKRELPESVVGDISSQVNDSPIDMFDIVDAIEKLAACDSEAAEMIQLRYFFGFEDVELAALFQRSTATVERTIRFAKAWLLRQVESDETAVLRKRNGKK